MIRPPGGNRDLCCEQTDVLGTFATMTWLQIDEKFQPLARALGWTSFAEVMAQCARQTRTVGKTLVRRMVLEGAGDRVDVFFKEYRFPSPSWRFWLRQSKARREYETYAALAELGLPVAGRIAAGEKRDALGRLSSAFIVTRAVSNSQTLLEFAGAAVSNEDRRAVLGELAGIVARMHAGGFFHYDLFWRNVLVSRTESGPKLFLIDCPRGRHHHWFTPRHRLRDLASLDKDAVAHCRRAERLRFLLAYLGKARLDADAKQMARACLSYASDRWRVEAAS